MSDDLLNDLENFKSKYYSSNTKNVLFKNTQKIDLANRVCEQFGLNELFVRTVFIIPNTNKVYINYPLLKLFANPSNYEQFAFYTHSLFNNCIQQYGCFECHVNMESLTVSAVERHRKLIEIFARDPVERGIEYIKYMTAMYIYNTPGMIESITKIISYLLEPELVEKIIAYNKADTTLKLGELLQGC